MDILNAGTERPEGKAAIIVGQFVFPGGEVSIRDCFIDGSQNDGVFVGTDGSLRAFERNTIRGTQGFPVTVRRSRR